MSHGLDESLDRRSFLALAATGAGALAFGATNEARAAHGRAALPNLVLITADDLGYGDLSGYGRADYQTPVLDRLASEGMRFTQAYAIAPVCTPTRVGLMTGRYPARHPIGLREPLTLSPTDRALGLEPFHPTLSSHLRGRATTPGFSASGTWECGRNSIPTGTVSTSSSAR